MNKSKHSQLFKIKLAKLSIEELGSGQVAEQYDVSSRQIRYWAQVYAINGVNAFTRTKRSPSAKYKLSVLQKMWTNNWSIGHTSAYFNKASTGILFKWNKDYSTSGISGLEPRKKGRTLKEPEAKSNDKPAEQMSDKELHEELEYLRAENAVLKKLEALAQKKRALAKKNR
jgi:transposase